MKYRTLRSIVRFIMKIIADIEIDEIDKLPQGNVIVAANHLGRLDTAVLLCVLDFKLNRFSPARCAELFRLDG